MPKTAEKKAAALAYDADLRDLQVQLVNMQVWAMAKGRKIVILFEGGLGLEVATVRRALGETLTLTLTTSVVTAGLVAVIAVPSSTG